MLAAILAVTASAFVPQSAKKAAALSAVAPEKEIGVIAPLGFFE